jgi:hypothetical protein
MNQSWKTALLEAAALAALAMIGALLLSVIWIAWHGGGLFLAGAAIVGILGLALFVRLLRAAGDALFG